MANRPRCGLLSTNAGNVLMPFNTLLQTGLVAILRGVKPDEIVAIGEKRCRRWTPPD
ncbi:hypothetical protein O5282_00025 [Escherichia coli]|nr:hypothetical protein [Escherichia coli]